MLVFPSQKLCSVQNTFLPKNMTINEIFANAQNNDNELVTAKAPMIQRKQFESLQWFQVEHNELPAKFQPYCPASFKIVNSQTVEKDLVSSSDDHHRQKRWWIPEGFFESLFSDFKRSECRTVAGDLITPCHRVETQCPNNQSCSGSNMIYTCQTETWGSACSYTVIDCLVEDHTGTKIRQSNCIFHITTGQRSCRPCCMSFHCGDRLPKCSDDPFAGN